MKEEMRRHVIQNKEKLIRKLNGKRDYNCNVILP